MNAYSFPDGSGQRGIVLLDALIAILIFSIGVLGMVKLQSDAISYSSEAKYRVDAAMLADQVIGQMWVADPATLQASFNSPGGPKFVAWQDAVTQVMPQSGKPAYAPTIIVLADGTVTVTVNWLASSDKRNSDPTPEPHSYVSITQVVR